MGPRHNSVPKASPRLFPLSSGTSDSMVLGCLAQGFFPEPVNMTWSYSGEGTMRNYPAASSGSTYIQTSILDLSPNQCSDTGSYQCHIEHYNTNKVVEVPCKGCKNPCPCETTYVSLSPPSLESLLLGTGANLTCTVGGLKDSKGVKFTWVKTPAQASTFNPIQGTPQQDSSGKYSVSSVLEICAEEWNRGDTFSCTVSHPEIETTTKTISKPKVPLIPPVVFLLPPSADEVSLNEMVSIICLARNLSPKEALLHWMEGSEKLPRKDYIISGPYPEPRGTNTFMISSILQVSASAWKKHKYTCVVGHEALPLNFTQQTIDQFSDHWKKVITFSCLNEDFVEEDDRDATLWPMTVTFLTLFLLSMFYNTTVTLIKTKSGPAIKY